MVDEGSERGREGRSGWRMREAREEGARATEVHLLQGVEMGRDGNRDGRLGIRLGGERDERRTVALWGERVEGTRRAGNGDSGAGSGGGAPPQVHRRRRQAGSGNRESGLTDALRGTGCTSVGGTHGRGSEAHRERRTRCYRDVQSAEWRGRPSGRGYAAGRGWAAQGGGRLHDRDRRTRQWGGGSPHATPAS